jgi:hypothetical protein
LQASCDVWRIADDAMLLRDTFADEVANDDQARGDTNSDLKARIMADPVIARPSGSFR